MDKYSNAFREEASELLDELEQALLELESTPDNSDLINRVFRAMHTLKGSGAMFGFNSISKFTHEIETIYDLVRDQKIEVTLGLITLSLKAKDHIKAMLKLPDPDLWTDTSETNEIINAFKALMPKDEALPHQDILEPSLSVLDEIPLVNEGEKLENPVIYRIRFKPLPELFKTGTNPLLLLDELSIMGECKVFAIIDSIPNLPDFDPEICYLYWDIILNTAEDINAIKDVFIFVEDLCELSIQKIEEFNNPLSKLDERKLGEILLEKGDLDKGALEEALKSQKKIGEVLVESNLVTPQSLESALTEQDYVRQVKLKKQQQSQVSSIRVAASKLDKLVDLVGELVTVQARLKDKSMGIDDSELFSISEVIEQLTGEIRDNTMSIRMLPIDLSFNKLKRLIRDISSDLGKDVQMVTEGGETELDKTVIEQLNDPLVHIIRNSIDHGIELPDIRERNGKPRQGKVLLSAEHSGANVIIRVSDDGKGLDRDIIRNHAIQKEIISPDDSLSDENIFELIFHAGLSTNENVTDLSGRGVGMDVVKRSIQNLQGSVRVDSEKGEGTSIILKLPLTLAIIDGILVQVDSEKYIIPLSHIEECVDLTREYIKKTHGQCFIKIRDQIVPYIRIRNTFELSDDLPEIEQIVICRILGKRIGIVVDRVIGEHQIVIKTMSKLYQNIETISGATILGDGSVALILDILKLSELSEENDISRNQL